MWRELLSDSSINKSVNMNQDLPPAGLAALTEEFNPAHPSAGHPTQTWERPSEGQQGSSCDTNPACTAGQGLHQGRWRAPLQYRRCNKSHIFLCSSQHWALSSAEFRGVVLFPVWERTRSSPLLLWAIKYFPELAWQTDETITTLRAFSSPAILLQ